MRLVKCFFIVVLSVLISKTGLCFNLDPDTVEVSYQLEHKLKAMENIVSVEKIQSDIFAEKYLLIVRQPLDHNEPDKGYFNQRVFVSHISSSLPVVMVCEGYGASYAASGGYREELSKKLSCNLVVVEHRFFNESTPNPIRWEFMNGKNAADDLHAVNKILRNIYNTKWISTGISKGGQNSMIYRTYYPDDVDISVAYVGPVCFGVEDGRHEPFIKRCGTKEDRVRILEFQREILKRKDRVVPMLAELAEKRNWNFPLPYDEILDYCVLEFSFSLWQWGTPTTKIPSNNSTDEELFNFLMSVASASYFGEGSYVPFFVQAATDLGYYGYDTRQLKDLLTINSSKGYLKNIFLEEENKSIKFNDQLHKDIYSYFRKNDPKMIFIYGEFDPWSAAMPSHKLFRKKQNMKIYIQKNGSHSARIASMPKEVEDEIWNSINLWLNE